MKRIFLMVLVVVMAVSIFAACASQTPEPSPSQVVSTEPPTETPTTPSADADAIPTDVSPTTGLVGNTEYKPVIVQIENEPPARPQAGLQQADIVYETMIEGIDTRFTCIFNDTYPEEVGPVRSSRYYHQRIQQEWDALYVHQGGPDDPNYETTYIYGESGDHIKQRINGVKGPNADLIYRRKGTGKALEHTAYTNVAKDAKEYSYTPTALQNFKFYPLESYADYEGAKEVADVQLSFWSKPGFVSYTYDKTKDKFIRYMNGKEFIAEETGEPVEVQNIILQYATVVDAPAEGGRKLVNLEGEGPAEFYIHGKHMSGKWSRPSYTDRTVYTLENGEEITLAPGNTWIEIHPNNKTVITNYADGTEFKQN